jgi:hypothetical protein
MPRVTWPLEHNRPVVHVQFIETAAGHRETRMLLADTGAGGLYAPFELILRISDCQRYMGLRSSDDVALGGAIIGTYPIYAVRVEIPTLSVARRVRAVAVSDTACPAGMDGIACFRFLSTFMYGNFGDRRQFGLEIAEP